MLPRDLATGAQAMDFLGPLGADRHRDFDKGLPLETGGLKDSDPGPDLAIIIKVVPREISTILTHG